MKPDSLVSAGNLVVRRGRFALSVPQWEVAAGEVVGVVGPNGAGKTTLLETIAGFRRADAGGRRDAAALGAAYARNTASGYFFS